MDYPHFNEGPRNLRPELVWNLFALLVIVALAFMLSGCASWGDYASEVRTVNASIAAEKKAQADRDRVDEQAYLTAMQGAQSDVARVAMAGFWALAKVKGGGAAPAGAGYVVPTAPRDPMDTVIAFAGAVVPTLGNVAMAYRNSRVMERQSDNAMLTAVSSNGAMVALGTQGSAVASQLVAQIPNLRPSMTFTIGRDGVIGDGTFSSVTQALTTGGDGVLGGGSITRPANPTRVCSVDPATGTVSCS